MVGLLAAGVPVGQRFHEIALAADADLAGARAIVQAVANWDRPDVLREISTGLPQAMRGISLETLAEDQLLAKRGW